MVAKAAAETPPTSQMSSANRQAGFTLIEVMAVMLIIALVSALAVTTMRGTGRAQLYAVSLQTAALMRRERLGAILTASSRQVSLDGRDRVLFGDGGSQVRIPSDVVVDILGNDTVRSGRLAVVRFQPDGASTGAVLRLSREQATYEVSVNWYTGSVIVRQP
jgi:general secretion pathway protein H